jgi:hypothetical protein
MWKDIGCGRSFSVHHKTNDKHALKIANSDVNMATLEHELRVLELVQEAAKDTPWDAMWNSSPVALLDLNGVKSPYLAKLRKQNKEVKVAISMPYFEQHPRFMREDIAPLEALIDDNQFEVLRWVIADILVQLYIYQKRIPEFAHNDANFTNILLVHDKIDKPYDINESLTLTNENRPLDITGILIDFNFTTAQSVRLDVSKDCHLYFAATAGFVNGVYNPKYDMHYLLTCIHGKLLDKFVVSELRDVKTVAAIEEVLQFIERHINETYNESVDSSYNINGGEHYTPVTNYFPANLPAPYLEKQIRSDVQCLARRMGTLVQRCRQHRLTNGKLAGIIKQLYDFDENDVKCTKDGEIIIPFFLSEIGYKELKDFVDVPADDMVSPLETVLKDVYFTKGPAPPIVHKTVL